MNYALSQPGALLFFGGQRKVTKETRPAIAENSLALPISVAWAKLADGWAGRGLSPK